MRTLYASIFALFFFLINFHVHGQKVTLKEKKLPLTRVLIIFDASYSMIGQWESDSKMRIAKKLLGELLDSLEQTPNLELALRCYGHQSKVPPQDCGDTRLEIPFAPNNASRIKHRIKSIVPKGTTPIARSLQAAANDFPDCRDCRNIILLITDGLEECDGDPCAVSQELRKKGIILKPFVIGIGTTDLTSLECIGTYFNAANEQVFRNVLNVVINHVLHETTCQVNLLDSYGAPTETNVPVSFFDHFSGMEKYNIIHTMNSRGLPDTLVVDHMLTYNVVAHTIPPTQVDSIRLTPGKHNIIPIDAPQGILELKIEGRDPYKGLNCIVRKNGETSTLHIQNFSTTTKYITGYYDLEVLCLPRIHIKGVEIKQNHTTTVNIPQPGVANILLSSAGYGSIFVKKEGKLELVYRLDEELTQQSLLLQPGEYVLVYRNKFAKETTYTLEHDFTVRSGMPSNIKL